MSLGCQTSSRFSVKCIWPKGTMRDRFLWWKPLMNFDVVKKTVKYGKKDRKS